MYEIIIEMLEKGRHRIQLSPDEVQLVLLLFADDAVILSDTLFICMK